MKIRKLFDTHPDGYEVYSYTFGNDEINASVIEHGATLQSFKIKDKNGKTLDIIGGFDKVKDYMTTTEYQGSTVGRVANRIKNSTYILDGKTYKTYANEGPNSLHGGKNGFNTKLWKVIDFTDDHTELEYVSADGEEGYPGNLTVRVKFSIIQNSLRIDYLAYTDKLTIINLTNHSYFNLNGYDGESVENQELFLNSDLIVDTGADLIPTGKLLEVSGTAFDLNKPANLGDVFKADDAKIIELGGLDTCYVFKDHDGTLKHQGDLYNKSNGLHLKLLTDETSIQIYTSNSIGDTEPIMKNGVPQKKHFGICLETSSIADSINNENFDDITLAPGETYKRSVVFEIEK